MKLLVIIVTYNAMHWAERCFSSLKTSSIVPDIFVVDNGSTDGTQAYIQEHYPEVMFHQSKENLGFGKANNLGIQFALDYSYDYVYLLNQDAWVMENTFEQLIYISRSNPEYGVLSPFQMNADMIHIDRNFVKNVMRWNSNPNITNDLYNQQTKDVYPVSAVMAAHWLITRECLLKVGGFSPSFPHYGEDYNYADRMHYWGFKLGIIPSIKAVHDRGWREDTDKKKIYLQYTKSIRMMSNPNKLKYKSFFTIICKEVKNVIHFKSLLPLFYLWKLICHMRSIENDRIISTKENCAFLKTKQDC